MEQEVTKLERCADDDVAVVELSRDESPAVPPVEQTVAATFGDTFESSGQAAEFTPGGTGVRASPTL